MATDFAALSKVEPLVVRWKAAEIPAVFAGEPAAVSSFKIAGDANRYAVVVNDDCQAESQLDLAFLPNTREVVDLLSGQTLALTPDSLGQEKLLRATLSLQPGAGTILRVAFSPAGPGHLLVDEDFALRLSTASFDHVECVEEPGGFGLGSRHAVRAQAGQSKDATITFDKLNLPPGRGGLLAGNLHKAARGEANVYLFIDGRCPQPESLVVQLVDDKGNAGWDKTVGYELPLLIPPTTQSIRIRPSDDAAIYRVRFWASPTAKTD